MAQCQANTSRGPCQNRAKSGSDYCRTHTKDSELANAYRIADPDLQATVEWHSRAKLLDISSQIVLLRSLVEERLNMADGDNANKIAAYNFVAAQLQSLTKMTETMVKLARESGELMERGQVEGFVDKVIDAVSDELTDLPDHHERVDRIISRIDEIETDE